MLAYHDTRSREAGPRALVPRSAMAIKQACVLGFQGILSVIQSRGGLQPIVEPWFHVAAETIGVRDWSLQGNGATCKTVLSEVATEGTTCDDPW